MRQNPEELLRPGATLTLEELFPGVDLEALAHAGLWLSPRDLVRWADERKAGSRHGAGKT